jgi:hypothetical protein
VKDVKEGEGSQKESEGCQGRRRTPRKKGRKSGKEVKEGGHDRTGQDRAGIFLLAEYSVLEYSY